MNDGRVVTIGDGCALLRFDAGIDANVNARCIAIAEEIERARIPGVRDVVPTYDAVAVHFDPRVANRETVIEALRARAAAIPLTNAEGHGTVVEIPVRYGGADGPDLADVAVFGSCSQDDVIRLHSSAMYRVFMLGFLPGFAYMGAVDPRIAMPRLDAPRARVAAGSVGIAGQQTGIYPYDTPGGWRVIGRTSLRMFDVDRPDPFLLKAGDRVRFVQA